METKDWVAVALALVAVVVYVLDRRIHSKAKRVQTSWNCIRCGVELGPMKSVDIRVAGSPHVATKARACLSCAERDRRIWRGGMIGVALAFLGTFVLLWLQ